jgi:hypothetical protein
MQAIQLNKPPVLTGAILLLAILIQLVASYLFVVRNSFYIADDIIAIDLAHQMGFWDFIQLPIDVHRVPLHRAANHLIHHLLPMRFGAATLLMLSCHAVSMLVLYRLLQRLNRSQVNLWLITAYALNAFVVIPLHWWSAGLHRFPYVLATILSCHFFVRFHDSNRYRDGLLALLAGLIAAGFYIKAILVPLYWAAILFCIMNFREWRKPARQYVLIAVACMCSLAYVIWYVHNSTDVVNTVDTSNIILVSLQAGISIVAQMPLQMSFRTDYAPWINLAWACLLIAIALRVKDAWRAIVACLALLTLNLLLIAASGRSSMIGAIIMLAPRYYFEVLFILAIFASLACRNIKLPATWRLHSAAQGSLQRRAAVPLVMALALYAGIGWRSALVYIQPGPNEKHWRCANYERNLLDDIDRIGVSHLNLSEGSLPEYFLYDRTQLKPLPLSTYLAWHGLHPEFGNPDKPLYTVDQSGNLTLQTKTATDAF